MNYKVLKKIDASGVSIYKKINEFFTYEAAKVFVKVYLTYNNEKLKIVKEI